MTQQPEVTPLRRNAGVVLVGAIFFLAVCGLVYELIAGTVASYLLGDSVTQFSIIIGLFLTAMGGGSFLSKFITRNLVAALVAIEMAVGIVGGFVALAAFAANAYLPQQMSLILYALVATVGILVGLEIPLVIRILKEVSTLRVTLANVLTADYIGALAASILFPFVLLPQFHMVRSGILIGLVNVGVATLLCLWLGKAIGRWRGPLLTLSAVSAVALVMAFVTSDKAVRFLENRMYQDEVIYAKDSQYQRIVVTRYKEDIRLYLDGHLQFCSIDEYQYHEALVHPAMCAAERREKVLILGGGDGLAAREILKYPEVKQIDIVDLDPAVTDLFTQREMFAKLNDHSLTNSKVHVHNVDALTYLQSSASRYDVILMDLPDPSRVAIAKLYSREFFGSVAQRLSETGAFATQATSPMRARQAFWCIVKTIESTGTSPVTDERLAAYPYRTNVESFGSWGFVLAGRQAIDTATLKLQLPDNQFKYLNNDLLPTLFVFGNDVSRIDMAISTLDNPEVWHAYERGYHKYLQ